MIFALWGIQQTAAGFRLEPGNAERGGDVYGVNGKKTFFKKIKKLCKS